MAIYVEKQIDGEPTDDYIRAGIIPEDKARYN
jgi:hypothetical protein